MSRKPEPDLEVDVPSGLSEQDARAIERRVARAGKRVAGKTSKGHDVKTPGSRGVPRVRQRDQVEMRQLTTHLPVPTFKKLGAYAIEADQSYSEIVALAIDAYVDARKAG